MKKEDLAGLHHKNAGAPVVVHHDDDRTELERWLRQILEQGPIVWGGLIGAVVLAAVAVTLLPYLGEGDSTTSEAWVNLALAKTADQQADVAVDFPKTKAATWALIQAATSNFNDGVDRLPTSMDSARPLLAKAQEQFQKALDLAGREDVLARRASLGLARCYEVRNELPKAIDQYESLAKTWPDTDEAREARLHADRLRAEQKKPESERFYTKLYAYKTPEMTLPPGDIGTGSGLPPLGGAPGLGGSIEDLLKGAPAPTAPPAPRLDLPPVFEPDDKPAPAEPAKSKDNRAPADPGGGILPPPIPPPPATKPSP
jgi:tetratricopeptide (TPR) repeat protein